MTSQLKLRIVDTTGSQFRLDEHTKSVGRRGIAQARAALRSARTLDAAPKDDDAASAA
ncbi:MAG: hypothetical protein OEY23_00770 [Acidimicrobiia bacterium]|nr:hypothetical protein [Acidimicrobiia bacterium]